MTEIPIGLQLYSVREDLARDPKGTLYEIAKMGYDGVELAGEQKHDIEELKGYLDEFGLECCGWHTPYAWASPDAVAETVRKNRILENRFLVIPGVGPEVKASREGWLGFAAYLERFAEALASHGMVTGYHNHNFEFTALGGELPWDTVFSNTGKGVVMQLDIGNGLAGGCDVLSTLRKYPGRSTTIHLKPYSFSAGKEDPEKAFDPVIGDDEVPWDEVFEICESTGGTEWYIVEYESPAYPAMEAVDRCIRNLRTMGK